MIQAIQSKVFSLRIFVLSVKIVQFLFLRFRIIQASVKLVFLVGFHCCQHVVPL